MFGVLDISNYKFISGCEYCSALYLNLAEISRRKIPSRKYGQLLLTVVQLIFDGFVSRREVAVKFFTN